MSTISVLQADIEHSLKAIGFDGNSIQQFLKIFSKTKCSQGVLCSLDYQKAMLVNVNGTEQGLTLPDYIAAWWSFWVVVFNSSNEEAVEHQALGAIRALNYVQLAFRDLKSHQGMANWWQENVTNGSTLEVCGC